MKIGGERLSWVIVSAVVVLFAAAGIDALRSSDRKPEPSATTTEQLLSVLPRCNRRQISVSIERRHPVARYQPLPEVPWKNGRRIATVVVGHGGKPCHQPYVGFDLKVRDRAGHLIADWKGQFNYEGDYGAFSSRTWSLPGVWDCARRGPFVARAVLGAFVARRGNLSHADVTC